MDGGDEGDSLFPLPPVAKTTARKATFMLRKLSTNFIAAAAKQTSSVCRSNRLFSVNLSHYVTEREDKHFDSSRTAESTSSNSSSSSDGDVCAVTMDEDAVFCLTDDRVDEKAINAATVRESLLASNGLRFDDISESLQTSIIDQFCTTVFAPGSLIVKQGDIVPGFMVVVSEGTAVTDVATGEWFSRGKVFSIESLAFNQHTCPYTLRVGEKYVVIATLPIEAYRIASVLKLNYLRSKYSILDTLSDSGLRRLKFSHQWLEPNDALTIDQNIALMTHGVTRLRGVEHSERMFPGQVIGVSEIMSSRSCGLIADTFAGCALISNSQFYKCMTKERAFMDAINNICYQHSVVVENYAVATVEEEQEEADSFSELKFTPTLIRTFGEDGTLHFNQYRVIKKIGTGATAAVFKVEDESAVKKIPHRVMKIIKRKDSQKAIAREIRALQTLQHPNVIRALDIIDSASATCVIVVQELAEWGSLLGVVLTMQDAKPCALGCARALAYVHKMGFIHSDVKPANILRNKHGAIKLADFGCTTSVNDTSDLRPRGTPAFMSPEVLRNEPCQASDVWAFVVTLFCLIYGSVPFRNVTTQSLREAIMYGEIPLQHIGTSDDEINFSRLCEAGLAKDHRKRITLQEIEEHEWLAQNHMPRQKRGSSSVATATTAQACSSVEQEFNMEKTAAAV
jgi:tRNA A-37 threonylcarbamoyl transferase component Bud32